MKLYCDGFTLGKNPSDEGGGFSIVDENKKLVIRHCLHRPRFTNNEGELMGILAALDRCAPGDEVSTDSLCAMSWVRRGRSKARPDLRTVCEMAREKLESSGASLVWEPREKNLAGLFNEGLLDCG